MNDYEKEIIEYTLHDNLDFSNSTIFITGATGFIGSNIVRYLITKKESNNTDFQIVVYVRNYEKAFNLFGDKVKYMIGDITNKIESDISVDYIIHCVDNTNSASILNNPVETLENSFLGTSNILSFARKSRVKGIVYLSSVEVYGKNDSLEPLKEESLGYLDLTNPRNSYPVGKLASENLVNNYFSQYNIPTKIVRLAQVAGPGIDESDNRFFSYLAKTVINNETIVLKTKGETIKDYLYILDAVEGILFILLNGKNGQTYNLTNSDNVYSVYEIAELFASKYQSEIKFEINNTNIYPNDTKLILSTKRVESLGFKPNKNINHIIDNLVTYLKKRE